MAEQSRHRSLDVLRGDVKRADLFRGARRGGDPVTQKRDNERYLPPTLDAGDEGER